MRVILFLHGMGHDPCREYWRRWAKKLSVAFHQKGLFIGEESFGGVYYYDLVPGPACGAGSIAPETKQLYLEELRTLAHREFSLFLSREGRSSDQRKRGWMKKLVDYLVDNFGDIFAYLYTDPVYQAVNKRVYEGLLAADGPVYLLGYSLGAIVGYCALQDNPVLAERVEHFIMLGNPLFWFASGVERRVNLRARPLVARWTNVAGIFDIAWPHHVPRLLSGLDGHEEIIVSRFQPIRVHNSYFYHPQCVQSIAALIAQTWPGDPR